MKRLIGFIISLVLIVISIIAGLFFFGALAIGIAGIVLLFFFVWILFYVRRRWHDVAAWIKEHLYNKKEKRNDNRKESQKRGRWQSKEEIVVGEIEEKE